MNRTYQLTSPLKTSFEWNKGPMPSGYAMVALELRPNPDSHEVELVLQSGKIWEEARVSGYSRQYQVGDPDKLIVSFLPTITAGALEGAKKALEGTLDRPVSSVMVVLEQFKVDLVYSTHMAFHLAAKRAIEQLLHTALQKGLLVVSD